MSHFWRLHFSSEKLPLNCGYEPSDLPQMYMMRLGRPTLMKLPSNAWEVKSHSVSSYGNNTGQQNLIFFFVPRTSIVELRSRFYAEFRFVYRIFLSGRISKIQRNLNAQNSTLCAHETCRNFPIKCRGVWLSLLFGVRYSYLQWPAIVCQHTWGPLALVLFIHSHNVLAKSFTVFVTDFAEIFWEKIQA